MVFVEEVQAPLRKALGAKFAPPAKGEVRGEYTAFVVLGAGWEDANGCYAPTGKVLFGAPVFENDHKCLLSREQHTNSRTGKTAYGWILGQDRKPLYAVESDALLPPASGWLMFSGLIPVPKITGMGSVPDAAALSAQNWKDQGNAYFGAQKYSEAEAKWTRGLSLADRIDDSITVALYSNRSEARLRMKRWDEALDDAQAALRKNPTHEKALLRAAVAARELKNYGLAQDFTQQCLDAYPRSAEAKQMMLDLEQLVHFSSQTSGGDGKLKEAWLNKTTDHDLPRGFSTKDVVSKKGFKAFGGYSSARKGGAVEKPPISSLPYHFMGLPPDQVAQTDMLYEEMRNFKEAKERMRKKEMEEYAEVKQSYKIRADEDQAMGKLAPLQEIMPAVKAKEMETLMDTGAKPTTGLKAKPLTALQVSKQQAERVELSTKELETIDALFSGVPTAAPDAPASTTGSRKEKLAKAKSVVGGRGKAKDELAKENKAKEEADKKKKAAYKEAATAALVAGLKEVVEGVAYADLDAEGKKLVDALKKYESSKNAALLEEFSYLVA